MPIPTDHGFPVKRPSFIQSCTWVGPDQQLVLKLTYFDAGGVLRQFTMSTRNIGDGTPGEVVLPTGLLGNDLHNLGPRYEDILTAHTRMACLVSRSGIPGSTEFMNALQEGVSANLNTALGVVKVTDVQAVDDSTIAITYKCGTGPTLTVNIDYTNLNNYVFVPDTQLFVIAGAIKKQFSTYVHDYPTTILSQTRRDDIVAYVMSLQIWI